MSGSIVIAAALLPKIKQIELQEVFFINLDTASNYLLSSTLIFSSLYLIILVYCTSSMTSSNHDQSSVHKVIETSN